jgi:Sulfotransferase family
MHMHPQLPAAALDRIPRLGQPAGAYTLNIVNVVGIGRSGSTVFGQVTANQPGLQFIGEMDLLWDRGFSHNLLCICGQQFRDCPFWSAADSDAFGGLPASTAEELIKLERRVVRERRLKELLSPGPSRAEDMALLVAYRSALYRAMAARGRPWLVDITKAPVYGLMISHLEGVALHVVHLVRDPRAVAFSWQRKVARNDTTPDLIKAAAAAGYNLRSHMQVLSPREAATRWMRRNLLAAALRPRAASFQLVRYEDFVLDPEDTMARVRRVIGLPEGGPVLGADGLVHLGEVGHAMGGNPRRRAGGTDVRLKLDDEWRRSLSRQDRLTVTSICAPLMVRYGYPLALGDDRHRRPSNLRSGDLQFHANTGDATTERAHAERGAGTRSR